MSTFLRALSQLVSNPGSNLVATTIGLAIVVLVVIVLLLLATAWVLLGSQDEDESEHAEGEGDDEAEDEEAAEPEPSAEELARQALWSRIRVWGVVTLLVAGVAGLYVVTSSNEYCGSTCHRMVPYDTSWRASTHRDVACVRCHEGTPGLTAVSGSLSRVQEAIADAEGSAISPVPVDSAQCLACHRSITFGVLVTKQGIRVKHQEIVASGAPCQQCHADVGHSTPKAAMPSVMSECLRCHDGKQASAACPTCHRGDVGATPLVERSYSAVALPPPTCGGCHSQAKCDACHGIRMPHPVGWENPQQHARLGAFGNRQSLCYRCHTFKDCNQCHQELFEHGHPGDWKTLHARYPVSAGATYCIECHRQGGRNFCLTCHPGFASRT